MSDMPSELPRARLALGLIGDNILQSRSPALHRIAGRLSGIDTSYELLVPARLGKDFATLFDDCRKAGMRGLNITYPYKERVLSLVRPADPFLKALGSINTVLFEADGPVGYNTDHSGFIAAYRARFADAGPGAVALVGAGGVGRAIAFGLAIQGATEIRIADHDGAKAAGVADAVRSAFPGRAAVVVADDAASALDGATGAVNCTPIGMSGYPGSALPADRLAGCRWAFDAVYTPVETTFKRDCEAAGVAFLSGYELFFHQGVDAFQLFSGTRFTETEALRRALAERG